MLVIFAAVMLASAVKATDFNKCSSGEPPVSLSVVGCEKQPCNIKTPSYVVANISFTVDHAVSKLTPDLETLVLGNSVEYPLPQKDGCIDLIGSSCPLKDSETATYRLQIGIPPSVMKTDVQFTFTMTDQDNKPLTCFILNARIV